MDGDSADLLRAAAADDAVAEAARATSPDPLVDGILGRYASGESREAVTFPVALRWKKRRGTLEVLDPLVCHRPHCGRPRPRKRPSTRAEARA